MPPKLEDLSSPWPSFLKELDNALSAPVELHCLGGFVLAVLHGLPRPTDDLDYISVVPRYASNELEQLAGRGSKLSRKYKVFLQNVSAIPDVPESYEDRLAQLDFGLSKLSLRVLDPYDLALSKLTRNSPKDREDVKLLTARLNLSFKTLTERFEREMKPWLPNPERHTLTLEKLWREYFS
jgi:hypothetical protein